MRVIGIHSTAATDTCHIHHDMLIFFILRKYYLQIVGNLRNKLGKNYKPMQYMTGSCYFPWKEYCSCVTVLQTCSFMLLFKYFFLIR